MEFAIMIIILVSLPMTKLGKSGITVAADAQTPSQRSTRLS